MTDGNRSNIDVSVARHWDAIQRASVVDKAVLVAVGASWMPSSKVTYTLVLS